MRKKCKKTSGYSFGWRWAVFAVLAGFSLAFFAACSAPLSPSGGSPARAADRPPVSSFADSSSQPALQPREATLRFSAVGDNLIHSSLYEQAAARAGGNGYDFAYVYENVEYFFRDFDVNWINQETLVNAQLPPATYPCFSTPAELGWAAYDAGWRVFSLANNHVYDMGAKGLAATREFWDSMPEDALTAGLYKTGDDGSGMALQQVGDFTLAYLSYTEFTNGIPTPQGADSHIVYTSERETMERQIRRAAEIADAVLVGVHWGIEGSHHVTDAQRALAADFSEWGADVVIGTHPHVIQPVEWVESPARNTLVAYSLGNFLSAQSQPENLIGLALSFELRQTIQPDGTRGALSIEQVRVTPTITHYDSGYSNIRNYMLRDYTAELAAKHGVHKRGAFSLESIQNVLDSVLDGNFLSI